MDLNADSSAFTNDMKAILGYEGLYSVTRDGRVWSHAKKAFKVLQKSHKGYLRVALYSGKGKSRDRCRRRTRQRRRREGSVCKKF